MRDEHRIVFVAYNGPGPWPCVFCNKPVELREKFVVHHIDGNRLNDEPSNLCVAHGPCHTGHHHTGRHDIIRKMIDARSPESCRKAWNTRRQRYGPPGGNPKGDRMTKEQRQIAWETRRVRYGTTGRKV